MPLTPSAKRNFIGSSLEASHVLGARVLARTETDGYYHLGRIVQEVKLTVYWELVCKSMYVFSLFFPYHTSPKPLLWGGPPVLQCTS